MNVYITFVHLGKKIPAYLTKNIIRTRELFPQIELVVAGQSEALAEEALAIGARYLELPGWLGEAQSSPEGLARADLDQHFWGGYWQKTFDRLIALDVVHRQLESGSIVHLENDVILTRDFPFDAITAESRIMWGAYDDKADIASIVYSPSAEHTSWLSRELIEVASENASLSDMGALRVVRARNTQKIGLLPATPEESLGTVLSGTIFDGLHIGEWIFGWDPKAHWGFKRRRIPINAYSTIFSTGTISMFDSSMTVTVEGATAKVANLHVHSKELRFFDRDVTAALEGLLVMVSKPRGFYGFVPSAFVSWSISRFHRWSQTLLRLVGRFFSRVARRTGA